MGEVTQLVDELKCKEMTKQISIINSRLKAIQETLYQLQSGTSLSEGIARIMYELNEVIMDGYKKYKTVTFDNSVGALEKVNGGDLCVRVYFALQKSEKKTPLQTIMRGLMSPKAIQRAKEIANENAVEEWKEFSKDIENLTIIIKKGNTERQQLKTSGGIRVILENLDEFNFAKDALDNTQDIEDEKESK